MDKNANAVEQLKTGIKTYIDKKADEIPCDKTFTALVTKVSSNGFYSISLNGVEYNNIRTIGGTCKVNESVKVLVPQNNYNNMFILKGIEDVGSYKLYEYQNENAIDINEGNTKDRKYYSWVNTKGYGVTIDPTNPCYFYIDNEYYVTDDEEYITNPICYGYSFIQTPSNSGTKYIRYKTMELKNVEIKEKSYGYIKKTNTTNNSGKWVEVKFNFSGYFSIHNDDNGFRNTTVIENTNTFPPTIYIMRADYNSSTSYGVTFSQWGDKGFDEFCCGYISTNIPIFESIDDGENYCYAETKEESLLALKKAINYKEKNYKEIFSTSVLMNENSKIKIDAEILMNYNNDNTSLLLQVSQDYGHGYFKLNDGMIKNIINDSYLKYKTNTNEFLHNFVILLDGNTSRFSNNTNAKIAVCVFNLKDNSNKCIREYNTGSVKQVRFYGDYCYIYYINLDGTIEYISQETTEYLSIPMLTGKGHINENFYYNKNNILKPFNNTFIPYYPLYISPSCDNAIYDANKEKIIGRFVIDKAISVNSMVNSTGGWYNEGDYSNITLNALLGKYYDYPKYRNIDLDNIEIQYYVNDELVETRNPRTMLTDGGNILRLMYILSSESGGMNKISIRLCVKKGKISINEKGIWISISGSGLLDQTYWNGDIEISQDFELINPIDPIIVSYDEDIDVDIVERPIMRKITWGYLFNNNLSWQNVKDRYIW